MRQRFNRYSLCSHTSPEGQSYIGEQEKLRKKFERGNITKDELRSYALMAFASKGNHYKEITVNGEIKFDLPENSNKFITVKVFGKDMRLTIEEYNTHFAKCDF